MWWRSSSGPPVDWPKLLCDLCKGSHSAQTRAFEAFSSIIEERLIGMGAHRYLPSCDDLIHDVIETLLKNADSIREPAAWVRRATYNAYIDWIRRESHRRRKLEAMSHHVSPMTSLAPPLLDEAVFTKEELRMLQDAIRRLPPKLRRIIDSVYPEDPHREPERLADVASKLCIPETMLKNRLRKATSELGRELRRRRALGRFRCPLTTRRASVLPGDSEA